MNPDNNTKGAVAHIADKMRGAIGRERVTICEGSPCVCVRPKTKEEVAKIVSVAKANKISVTSSNNPSMTMDGMTPIGGKIYIDLSDMCELFNIDKVAMSVRAAAGCPLKTVIEACEKEGFTLGSYPYDRSLPVGAWAVSTMPGYGSYKFGTSKDNIMNIQVVSENSSILETGYDNIGAYMSGYNLTQLFSGSEGTLGVVTAVTLRVYPNEVNRLTAYKFDDRGCMQEAMTKLVQHASVKPRDIEWCGKNLTMAITLSGTVKNVDFEEQALDALMVDAKGAKVDKEAGCNICKWVCGPAKENVARALAPVKNWKQLLDASEGYMYGAILDRGIALFMSNTETESSITTKAKSFNGRALLKGHITWTPSRVGKEVEKLSRKVTANTIEALKKVVGEDNVTTHGVDLLLYSKDMAPLPKEAGIAFNNMPDVVVRPSKVEEISEIVKIAYADGLPIVPRGNSSWGLGGCMPTSNGIVIDMSSKMNKIHEINTDDLYVKVDVGCTWKELLDACMKKGYIIGSYPSSFPSATLGAWISTDGMGVGSYKYGSAKSNIINMELVLSDGTIVKTGCDHTGSYGCLYNLNQFFAGSEGTLCTFGTVTFRIYPFGGLKPLVYSYENMRDMQGTMNALARNPSIIPLHISFEDELHFSNQRLAGVHAPDAKNLLLMTLQGDKDFLEFEAECLDAIAAVGGGVRIDDDIGVHEWSERCYEFRARRVGVGEIPAEVIVPVANWGKFTDECYRSFDVMKMEAGGVIGVMVDRNTSLLMPYYFKDDESLLGMTAFAFNFYVGDRAAECGGRTTGFGVFFAWNLDNIHDAETVAFMRNVKTRLDPRDVANPGHLVCGNTRFGIKMNKQLMSVGSKLIQAVKKILPKNTTFMDNRKRFRYDTLEHRKEMDRIHDLGDGTQ